MALERDRALAALAERRAKPVVKIDNARLPAGAPMYYYCRSCDALADVKPEGWFRDPPRKLCPDCQYLQDQGWLESPSQ